MKESAAKSNAVHQAVNPRAGCAIRRRALGWLAAGVGVASLLLAAPQQLLAQQPPVSAQSAPRRVTLITGDRVLVSGPNLEGIRIERAPGRERMRFTAQRVPVAPGQPAHLFVIPEDAARLVQAGQVDRRLFDVTLLVASRYDDAHRDSLPFIVTYPRTSGVRALPRALPGAVADRALPSVNGVAVSSPKAQVRQLWNAVVAGPGAGATAAVSEPIGKIWLDALHHPTLERSAAQIGAPRAWELGYEGDGVIVAVLDTGVDEAHPDLIDTVVVSENFTVAPDGDQVGHGTHVASIIAGSGAASGGLYRGVAPSVQLLAGKVCEDFGCAESSMIAGMHWAAAEEGAQVVNLSITGFDTPGMDPLEETVDTLTAQYGTLFVISAGNDGGFFPVGTAASAAAALAVGAVDREDAVADFSSRGLTVDGLLKPDLTAPGVEIVAARAAGTELGALVGDDYVAASGTSMAAPHAAGAAALLLQRHPTWRGADVKAALMGTAVFHAAYPTTAQGAGRVDIAAALDARVLASAASLSLGLARWPHEDDEPVVRTLAYRNLGPATELALELDITAPDGSPPPAGMFALAPSSVSLAEGGSASVRLTADTRVPAPDGLYSGRVIATDGSGQRLAVPLVLTREVESYELTVRHLDRAGQPTANWFANLVPYAGSAGVPWVDPPSGGPQDVVLRLPKGRYAFESMIYGADPEFPTLVRLLASDQMLDADTLLVLDGSAADPVTVVSPQPGAENLGVNDTWGVQTDLGWFSSALLTHVIGDLALFRAEVGPRAASLRSYSATEWRDTASTPQDYFSGIWTGEGELPPSRLELDLERAAIVDAHYAAPLTSLELIHEVLAPPFHPDFGYLIPVYESELPLTRTERYVTTDPSFTWQNELWMHDAEYSVGTVLGYVSNSYAAGERYASRWNEPVFSPAMPSEPAQFQWIERDGDVLLLDLPRYGDRGGHAGFISSQGRIALSREGELVDELGTTGFAFFELPPEPATYRLELDEQQSLYELTTQQQVAWTFRSAHVEEGSPERVPLLVVRFTPELDERGRAPCGARFRLPIHVEQYDRAAPLAVGAPRLAVSYDDGATWAAARVAPDGDGWAATLDHPERAQYVSLRTSAHDASGNAVEQTLIRAYALAPRP